MLKQEKIKFINDLIDNVKTEILNNVDKMPDDWDGVELRMYCRDTMAKVVWKGIETKRKRAYNNAILINNL